MHRARVLAALLAPFALSLAGCGAAAPPAPPPCPCEATAPAPTSATNCNEGIPYELPRAGEAASLPPPLPGQPGQDTPGVLHVTITADGTIRVSGQALDFEGLRRLATARHEKEPDVRAVIHADRATPWKNVIEAIDGIKSGGIAKLAFAVAPANG